MTFILVLSLTCWVILGESLSFLLFPGSDCYLAASVLQHLCGNCVPVCFGTEPCEAPPAVLAKTTPLRRCRGQSKTVCVLFHLELQQLLGLKGDVVRDSLLRPC